ncbi:MAG: hypothetical protein R2762_25105 [Bryobacteraceae bacterium]
MSFLDNLENNLKALESREEQDPAAVARARDARKAERAEAVRRAPFEQALKSGSFAGNLIAACRKAGHPRRILVRPVWLDSVLRLEGRWDDVEHRLELHPTGDGVRALFFQGDKQTSSEAVDLEGPADALADGWVGR